MSASDTTTAAAPLTEAAIGVWRLRWRRFRPSPRRHGQPRRAGPAACCSSLPRTRCTWITGIDPNETDLLSRFDPPSAEHWLGTDDGGRDELLRLMIGGQISLLVGLLATVVGGTIGLIVGVVSGYFGGRTDAMLMRFTDGMIALPLLPLLIVLGAHRPHQARFLRGIRPFRRGRLLAHRHHHLHRGLDRHRPAGPRRHAVDARSATSFAPRGPAAAGPFYVMPAHILPNVATPIIVAFTLTVGRVILFESVLSFLGFGIVPPTPSWGNMLNNAQELVTSAPGLAIYPGLLIFITVIAVNFLGDGLQHAFDPRSDR